MYLTPYSSLTWAYQLHYYLCFRTNSRRCRFESPITSTTLRLITEEICQRHNYHLLEQAIYADQTRCLISLRPHQAISKVIQTIKCNSARECGRALELTAPVWERGYLARSTGRMRVSAVRKYLEEQSTHHGYAERILPPVYRYRAKERILLTAAHATFELDHHLVFATRYRHGLFTSLVARALGEYWLHVAAVRGFAVDQISLVPDHGHLIVRTVPKLSIEECALSLMNNAQYFIAEHYPELLIEAGIDQVWQPSAYAGTCGEITTALLKKWLGS